MNGSRVSGAPAQAPPRPPSRTAQLRRISNTMRMVSVTVTGVVFSLFGILGTVVFARTGFGGGVASGLALTATGPCALGAARAFTRRVRSQGDAPLAAARAYLPELGWAAATVACVVVSAVLMRTFTPA